MDGRGGSRPRRSPFPSSSPFACRPPSRSTSLASSLAQKGCAVVRAPPRTAALLQFIGKDGSLHRSSLTAQLSSSSQFVRAPAAALHIPGVVARAAMRAPSRSAALLQFVRKDGGLHMIRHKDAAQRQQSSEEEEEAEMLMDRGRRV